MITCFKVVLKMEAMLGESPVWSKAEQALYFIDAKSCELHRFDPVTQAHRWTVLPEEIGSIGLVEGGGFIAALRSGIFRLDAAGRPMAKLADNPEDQSASRFNDGTVDPAGRFLVGTIDETRLEGVGGLYRYDQRGLFRFFSGVMTSNGLAFSPDGKCLYHADSPRFRVDAYDYDAETGLVGGKRTFIQFSPTNDDQGRPDGAAVDVDGCYWTALYEGGRIQRYNPDGVLIGEYPIDAPYPTMVAFGGADLATLFVTTARMHMSAHQRAASPNSGSLYAMRAPVKGRAPWLYKDRTNR